MLQRTAGSACFSLPMSRLYPRGESATLRAELSEEGMQMKKQLRGLFCAAVLAAMLAYDIVTEGVAVGVTKAVGFVLLILVAALGSRLGYLKF